MNTPSITAVCPEIPKGPPDLFFCGTALFSFYNHFTVKMAIPAGLEPATY